MFASFNWVGNRQFNSGKGSKTVVLSCSPWSDRIKGSWVVYGLHNCGFFQIISSKQHKYDLTGAGRRQPGRGASMAEDLNSGRPKNTPNLWSELESPDSESDALTTQLRCLLLVPYRNNNKSKSLNEKCSLIPWVFRVPYVLHEFLQISSLCKELKCITGGN